jgi:hypothetical protein
MRLAGSLLSCTYGSWSQVALDAPIEVTTLQLLVLATNLCLELSAATRLEPSPVLLSVSQESTVANATR